MLECLIASPEMVQLRGRLMADRLAPVATKVARSSRLHGASGIAQAPVRRSDQGREGTS